jgi:hypothetical protein
VTIYLLTFTLGSALRLPTTALSTYTSFDTSDDKTYITPPPHPPTSEPSSSGPPTPRPPPFSSLYFPTDAELDSIRATVTETASESLLATAPAPSFEEALAADEAESKAEAETKAALPQDTKAQSSKAIEDGEPPPPYTEGPSPLDSFTYMMAAAGGASSIITQVQQTAGPPINTLGGRLFIAGIASLKILIDSLAGEAAADEHITLDLRFVCRPSNEPARLTIAQRDAIHPFPRRIVDTPRVCIAVIIPQRSPSGWSHECIP